MIAKKTRIYGLAMQSLGFQRLCGFCGRRKEEPQTLWKARVCATPLRQPAYGLLPQNDGKRLMIIFSHCLFWPELRGPLGTLLTDHEFDRLLRKVTGLRLRQILLGFKEVRLRQMFDGLSHVNGRLTPVDRRKLAVVPVVMAQDPRLFFFGVLRVDSNFPSYLKLSFFARVAQAVCHIRQLRALGQMIAKPALYGLR
jgi:hypothetical protein